MRIERAACALLLLAGLLCRDAKACASCGSGGDDPLILAPDETLKMYVAASRVGNYQYIEPSGDVGYAVGPVAKDVFTLAIGKSVGEHAFVTATVPFTRNVGQGDQVFGLGDPLLTARWTAMAQSFVAVWEPQVQLMVGYKPAFAAAIQDAVHPQLLDVFGTGYADARAGLDLWWGMMDWKFGAALTGVVPLPRNFDGAAVRGGPIVRSTVTVGYGRDGLGRLVAGVLREDQFAMRVNGAAVAASGHRVHNVFATLDATITEEDTLRLTASRQGAFLSYNTSQANVVGMAYMRAW